LYEDLELEMFKEDQLTELKEVPDGSPLNENNDENDRIREMTQEEIEAERREKYIKEYIFGRDMLYIIEKWEKETFLQDSSEPSVGESSGNSDQNHSLSNSRTRKMRRNMTQDVKNDKS
jgi:hypothetical protein